MELELSPDQELFQETTRKFLGSASPVTAVRALRHDARGFDAGSWRQGAELGWTSLLVPEEEGGGSVSGRGLVDLTLVAHEFGRHAAPGPLLPANVVAAALGRSGSAGQRADALPGLLAGETVAAWAHAEPAPNARLGAVSLEARRDGGDYVLTGVKAPVEAANAAQLLLVSALEGGRLTQLLVPTDTAGLRVEPMAGLDLSRRFARVTFDRARVPADAVLGAPGEADEDVERQLRDGLAIQLAETAGAMDTAFEMTVEWAFNRYSFGRPLASYQELKHRFADMKVWLEASHAVAGRAARAVQEDADDAGEWVSVAKSYIGQYGPELAHDCVQLHGGIGVTYDHDLHLFLRRITVNRQLLGTPHEHRDRLVTIVRSRMQPVGGAR
ncbi:MAG: acyl-CoA dehydrogenase family protein [Acidimicrobiia bacterium]